MMAAVERLRVALAGCIGWTMRVERCDVRAVVDALDGRTTAPTDAEMAAHAEVGGLWLSVGVSAGGGVGGEVTSSLTRQRRDIALAPLRWWALAADGMLCAWPTVVPLR